MAAFDPKLLENVEQLSETDRSKVLVCRGATPPELHEELKTIFFDVSRRQSIINTLNSGATTLYDEHLRAIQSPPVVDLDSVNVRFATFHVTFDGSDRPPKIYLVPTASLPRFHCVQLDREIPLDSLISTPTSILHPLVKKIMHDAILHKYNKRGPISYLASLDIYYNRPRTAAGGFHRDTYQGRGNITDQVSLHFFMNPGDLALGPEVVSGIDATGRVIDPSEIQGMLAQTDIIPTRLLVGDGTNIGFSDTSQIHATPGLQGNLPANLTSRIERIEGRVARREQGLQVFNPNMLSKNQILLEGDRVDLENDLELARALYKKLPDELNKRIIYKQQIVALREEIIATNPIPGPREFDSKQETEIQRLYEEIEKTVPRKSILVNDCTHVLLDQFRVQKERVVTRNDNAMQTSPTRIIFSHVIDRERFRYIMQFLIGHGIVQDGDINTLFESMIEQIPVHIEGGAGGVVSGIRFTKMKNIIENLSDDKLYQLLLALDMRSPPPPYRQPRLTTTNYEAELLRLTKGNQQVQLHAQLDPDEEERIVRITAQSKRTFLRSWMALTSDPEPRAPDLTPLDYWRRLLGERYKDLPRSYDKTRDRYGGGPNVLFDFYMKNLYININVNYIKIPKNLQNDYINKEYNQIYVLNKQLELSEKMHSTNKGGKIKKTRKMKKKQTKKRKIKKII